MNHRLEPFVGGARVNHGRAARAWGEFPAEVVLASLGEADLADPRERGTTRQTGTPLLVGDGPYAAPELLLGSQDFGTEVDVWSVGCVAAELLTASRLFPRRLSATVSDEAEARCFLQGHFSFLGAPEKNSKVWDWMVRLPYVERLYGEEGLPAMLPPVWPPRCFSSVPVRAAALLRGFVHLDPEARPQAESVLRHPAFQPSALRPIVAMAKGKLGLGTIVGGSLDTSVLDYVQKDPVWEKLVAECLQTKFAPKGRCISKQEGAKLMKREFVGYVATSS